jgi:serine/threonine protein kinase/WD40 repeat protein
MNPNQGREETIFERAREIASAEERAAYLAGACGQDAALRERIESMLRDDQAAQEFFDTARPQSGAPPAAGPTIRIDLPAEQLGTMIGRYKLREKIGEGGCGVVYVAEQEEPVRRRVALKIIKLGMDTRSVVARFEAERQALAMMDHPNIAKVIDAGTTDTGRPYFVMELVRGVKLTDYCDQHGLTVAARLDLFVKICRAVQHAHQKGIIHRDLKPSNILVTLHDGVPVPKIIDFGIAKATEGRLTDLTVYTQLHQFIGTPAYMSPEQAEMSGLDIDTRSDIYSLGVLLYELLTSRTPFDPDELLRAGLDEVRRKIREDEPLRPSTRLSTMLNADLTTVARHHAAEPPNLINLLRGDLDWIVMKALEKDRTRRYETANGMAMDVERFLGNEPVLARPPSQLYRLRKFARRNRAAFAAAAGVSAALLLGLVISLWQAIRANNARHAAQRARVAADESRVRESQQRVVAEDNALKASESERTTQRLLYAADMRLAHTAWEEGNLARMTSLLEAHRPKPGEPDARGFEYYYLQNLAKGEQEQILVSHTNAVLNVALSPDGKWLASRGLTDTRLWDLGRRTVVAVWPSQHGILGELERSSYGLSFSHDSKYLAVASEQGLLLCELSTRQTRLLQDEAVERPVFSPVTNLIAFTGKAGIHVWDYLANQELGLFGPRRRAWWWSPDGTRLLAGNSQGSAGYIEWWDATTFKSIETDLAGQYLYGFALSRDGRLTAAADWQGAIWLLENPGGKVLGLLDCGDIRSSALAFSPDGKFLATASRDQAILIWDVASRQPVRQLRGHHAKVTSLAYTADGQILFSGDTDGKVLVWDMSSEIHHFQIANRLPGFGLEPPQFSADGKLLALAITDGIWSILDSSTLQPQSAIEGEFVGFSPDSRQVAYTARKSRQRVLQVSYFGAASPRASVPLLWTEGFSLSHLSPDGRYLVNTLATGIILFDASSGERLLSLIYPEADFSQKVLLPDGHTLVCAAGSALGFWDARSRQKTRTLDCGGTPVSLAVSPDGRFLAASRRDLKILLWDLRTGGGPEVFAGHQAMVWALAFSADGRTLASGGEDRCLKLWDLMARREIASFLQDKPVYWLAFAPDNQTLVWGGIGSYEVWRAPREAHSVPGPTVPPPSNGLPATSVWRVPDGTAPVPRQVLAEKNQCFTNLLRIHAALMSYQKDHQQMPDWLSDLVPKYVPDTNLLFCPVQAETGISSIWLPTEDPKVTSSYSYEFSAQPVSFSDPYGLAVSGETMKNWKTRQLGRYGPVVPVLRCSLHGTVLNVTYGGDLWESPQLWESVADVQWRARDHTAAEQWYRQIEKEGKTADLDQLARRWATAAIPEARDGPAAVRFAQKAVELTNRQRPAFVDTLSAAYAETGQFDKAVATELEAISLLKSSPSTPGMEATLKDYEGRLELYQHQRPYRQKE